jgi:hypothetical protein
MTLILFDDYFKTKEQFRGLLEKTEFERGIMGLIKSNFKDWWNFRVAEERRIYTKETSEYIWKQERGLIPFVAEVYYLDDYLCDITSKTQPDDALKLITNSIINTVAKQAREAKRLEGG